MKIGRLSHRCVADSAKARSPLCFNLVLGLCKSCWLDEVRALIEENESTNLLVFPTCAQSHYNDNNYFFCY